MFRLKYGRESIRKNLEREKISSKKDMRKGISSCGYYTT
jgi:hypothetical protein